MVTTNVKIVSWENYSEKLDFLIIALEKVRVNGTGKVWKRKVKIDSQVALL